MREEIDRFPVTLRLLPRPVSGGLIADLELKVMNC